MTGDKGAPAHVDGQVLELVAHRLFVRNAEEYGDAAMIELAWADPQVRQFWTRQTAEVAVDLARYG